MIRAEQIPPDAMYAAWKAMNAGMTLNDAIAAALNAWPGSEYVYRQPHRRAVSYSSPAIILPLPQEASDE